MELEPGVTLTIQTIDLHEEARQEVAMAREQGMDPLVLARTHLKLARLIEHYAKEAATDPCPYTFSHTRQFCGREGCRET